MADQLGGVKYAALVLGTKSVSYFQDPQPASLEEATARAMMKYTHAYKGECTPSDTEPYTFRVKALGRPEKTVAIVIATGI